LNDAPATLERRLGYRFSDPALLRRALTHRSKSSINNERLEFLGDSVLNTAAAAELYARFGGLSEGELTRLRASLVKQETLAALARRLELGNYLELGSGEYKSGGHDRDSILADALEAVLGAIFLEAGFDAARQVVVNLHRELFDRIDPQSVFKDPKTRLQEYLQKQSYRTPIYTILDVTGEAHNQHFVVECMVPDLDVQVTGQGSSRRNAEQEAAAKAFEQVAIRP
jgi:ribonuclease-3